MLETKSIGNNIWVFGPVLCLVLGSCVEEVAIEPEVQAVSAIEDILIVDATLTDEVKIHKVGLSRILPFQVEEPAFETGAQVKIMDNQGAEYQFEEIETGNYQSQFAFAAEQGKSYTLEINLSNGKKYISNEVSMPDVVPIGDIRAERMMNDREEEGVGIFIDNDSNGEQPTFFRYEYEETYKIIAPKWDPFRFEVVKNMPCDTLFPFIVDIVPWEDERKTCFGSSNSKRLIQTSSAELTGNIIDNFQLHFIPKDNYIISHRYSMNVTQHAQTSDAYSFYERLGSFSSSESLFSQVQPGFLEGNIALEANPREPALGYFEVTSVSKKRLYFNYTDLFPAEPLPPYPFDCGIVGNPPLYPEGYFCLDLFVCGGNCESPLIQAILSGQVVYAETIEDDRGFPFPNSYFTWPAPCGDCTQLGSNITPEFWTEE
jgi:hypothetical protein